LTGAIDPLELSRALIRCPSVTPEDGGALAALEAALEPLGFECRRLPFSEPGTADVDNLYAHLGNGAPDFCFAGHTDVVPVGDEAAWSVDPFGAEIIDGVLFGRGASDMKSAIACFIGALGRFTARRGTDFGGSISLLITGDEEAASINGTAKMLGWLDEQGKVPDVCLVGEPTNPAQLGEMIKIGRRGSLTGRLSVTGIQGHTAYPEFADNPLPRLVAMLAAIGAEKLDEGTEHFPPTDLQLTTIDVGNGATNVIPSAAEAGFNIRFNDLHTGDSLTKWLRDKFSSVGGDWHLDVKVSGEAFLTPPGPLSELVASAVERVTGRVPELGTTGGTSDARFIKDFCPVAEFGMINDTAHKVDENIQVADIAVLCDIYEAVLDGYFAP
jgi:succinyl-diaminopimelate desuccinylase